MKIRKQKNESRNKKKDKKEIRRGKKELSRIIRKKANSKNKEMTIKCVWPKTDSYPYKSSSYTQSQVWCELKC